MSDFIPLDAVATVPVTFLDQLGRTVAAPSGVTFTSAASGVDTLAFDGTNLTITPTAEGSDTISVAGLTGSLEISIGAPVAVSVQFGAISLAAK